jgi:hypothetical protein
MKLFGCKYICNSLVSQIFLNFFMLPGIAHKKTPNRRSNLVATLNPFDTNTCVKAGFFESSSGLMDLVFSLILLSFTSIYIYLQPAA